MPTWDGFTIMPPHTEFDDHLKLPSGIDIHHVDSQHAPDATIVAVPDSGVLMLGDSVYPPPFHLRRPDDTYDRPLIRRLLTDFAPTWYVGAHNHPLTATELRALGFA